MKKRLIYNLGRRGFFSEINNMILAKIFAQKNNYEFEVNSFYWNCRYKEGLRDYFELHFLENNNILSAQQTRSDQKFVILPHNAHDLFYNIIYVFNYIYMLFNKNIILGNTIFSYLRTKEFILSINQEEYKSEIRNLLNYNKKLMCYYEKRIKELGLSEKYIGVHIRRGDKITTGEMKNIPIKQYIDSILASNIKSIYIATDDISVISKIKDSINRKDINIFYNTNSFNNGFNEGSFNHSNKKARYSETIELLFDVYVLSKATYFIGTYSSNLSRVIPCFINENNCKSLDEKWYVG